ncbi:MAG: hypothetical protein ACM3N9_01165 [Syntrophothermus sp.]
MRKLVADSGSTKTQWVLLENSKTIASVRTAGMNPYFITDYRAEAIVTEELVPHLPHLGVDQIHFYGAGCSTDNNIRMLKNAMHGSFPSSEIEVYHDILGAARAVCGNTEGIACILGTGCNSCYYDGMEVYSKIPSLGYLFGDEGAGSYLGKKLLESYLKGRMPQELVLQFDHEFHYTLEEILTSLYNRPSPNRFLASFSLFIAPRIHHPFLFELVKNSFTEFFKEHIIRYENYQKLPVNFAGSIAWYYQDILKEVAGNYNVGIKKVLESPIRGLIEYHLE